MAIYLFMDISHMLGNGSEMFTSKT